MPLGRRRRRTWSATITMASTLSGDIGVHGWSCSGHNSLGASRGIGRSAATSHINNGSGGVYCKASQCLHAEPKIPKSAHPSSQQGGSAFRDEHETSLHSLYIVDALDKLDRSGMTLDPEMSMFLLERGLRRSRLPSVMAVLSRQHGIRTVDGLASFMQRLSLLMPNGRESDAYKMVAAVPELLLLSIEEEIGPRLSRLQEYFPRLKERLPAAAALLLEGDFEKVVLPRYAGLKNVLPSSFDVMEMVAHSPSILCAPLGAVDAAAGILRREVPELRFGHVLRANPMLLSLGPTAFQRQVRGLLKVLGCSASKLGQLINTCPQLITMKPEQQVASKIEDIAELLPGCDALSMVLANPLLLGFHVKRSLLPKVEALGKLLPGVDITALMQRTPGILCMSSATVAVKVERLEALLPSSVDIFSLIVKHPRLLTADLNDAMPTKLAALANLLPPGADLGTAIAQCRTLLVYSPEALESKGRILEELLPKDVVVSVLMNAPKVLNISSSLVQQRITSLSTLSPTYLNAEDLIRQSPQLLTHDSNKMAANLVNLRHLLGEFLGEQPVEVLINKAPMLLAISTGTLALKTRLYEHITGANWIQLLQLYPLILCLNIGRLARLTFAQDVANRRHYDNKNAHTSTHTHVDIDTSIQSENAKFFMSLLSADGPYVGSLLGRSEIEYLLYLALCARALGGGLGPTRSSPVAVQNAEKIVSNLIIDMVAEKGEMYVANVLKSVCLPTDVQKKSTTKGVPDKNKKKGAG